MRKLSGVRVVAAIVICVIVLSIGVQTAARVSTVFRDWIEQTFQIKSPSDKSERKKMAEVMKKKQEEFAEEITKQMKGKTPFHKLKKYQ